MNYQTDTITSYDGLKLKRYTWLPEGEPRGRVLMIHGFTEHGRRLQPLAERFARAGFIAIAPDLRGHGESDGAPIYIRSFDDFLADLDQIYEEVRPNGSDEPLFLFAHSMGGAISTLFTATRRPDIAGLALSAPAVTIGSHIYPILRQLAKIFSYVLPKLRLVRIGARWVSRDPDVITDFHSDPLNYHGSIPIRTAAEIMRATKMIRRTAEEIEAPLFLMQGTNDRICSPQGAELLYEIAGTDDKTIKFSDGLYHSLVEEPEKETVIGDLFKWVEARTPREEHA